MIGYDEEDSTRAAPVPWGPRDILAVFGLTAGILFLATIVLAALTFVPAVDLENNRVEQAALLALTLLLEATLFTLTARYTVNKYRCGWSRLGFRGPIRDGAWWLVPVLWLASFTIVGVWAVIVRSLGFRDVAPERALPEAVFRDPALIVLGLAAVVLAAPVAEETFFRGFMFSGLRSRWGLVVGAVASGVVFGAVHFQAFNFVPFAVIGVMFAIAYAYSGSLWITIASHLMVNATSFLATVVSEIFG